MRRTGKASPSEPHGSRRRPCPVCGVEMDVHAISGTEVDVCEAHGMWLDRGELGSIVRRFSKKQASLARRAVKDARFSKKQASLARRAVKDARFSGKVSAWLWGPLAFLLK